MSDDPLFASLQKIFDELNAAVTLAEVVSVIGEVREILGLCATVDGLNDSLSIGDRVSLYARDGTRIPAEVVGFRDNSASLMAFAALDGVGPGSEARLCIDPGAPKRGLYIDDAWLGRVIDPLGNAIDGKGPLRLNSRWRSTVTSPPLATTRARLEPRMNLGVRALDAFTTCRIGQRLGLFAGSGVGKSTLLSMLARQADCDVAVIALVGERGREVREFIEDDLGAEGLKRSVVVIATSDSPPLMRREAAYAAMAIAEYFRDQGKSVLLLMDSVTRFCLALREIGLSAGEPPATRGYPPSVFATLPALLERAGPGAVGQDGKAGFITALFTVLVEGDDHNEPVADAVRGILDGHIVLDRKIGEAGRYPAIDVLKSLSRSVPGCNSAAENSMTRRARAIMANYESMADMIRLGAYKQGTDPAIDEAIVLMPALTAFLTQDWNETATIEGSFNALRNILGEVA